MIGTIKNFFSDVQREMKKVSWPTREQLRESTIVVLVTTFLFTTVILALDSAFTYGVKSLF